MFGNNKIGFATASMFVFGPMFVGIGMNPAKGAPNGSPGIALCGFLLLIVGFAMPAVAYFSHKKKLLNDEGKKKNVGIIVLICVMVVVAIAMGIAFESSPSSDYSEESAIARCQSCDREFMDSANKSSISSTNMCSNCDSNYKWATEALGK